MSRRLQQYRRRFAATISDGADLLTAEINGAHQSALGWGRTQRHVRVDSSNIKSLPGVNKGMRCSLPIKPVKSARIAAGLLQKRG